MTGHVYAGICIGGPLDGEHLVHTMPTHMVVRRYQAPVTKLDPAGSETFRMEWVTYEHVPDVTRKHGDVWRVRP